MADEIQYRFSAICTHGKLHIPVKPSIRALDQSSPGVAGHGQVIGTSSTLLDFGDLTSTGGLLVMVNVDDDKTITWGPDTTGSPGTMEPAGSISPGMVASTQVVQGKNYYATVPTGTATLDVTLFKA